MENTFRNRLIMLLEKSNLSQSDLARKTGIRQSSISDWLRGKYEPKQDKIDIIAKALMVSPVYLMGYDIDSEIGNNIAQTRKNREITLEELAKASNIPVVSLKSIELGYESPDIDQVFSIANALDIDSEDIMSLDMINSILDSNSEEILEELDYDLERIHEFNKCKYGQDDPVEKHYCSDNMEFIPMPHNLVKIPIIATVNAGNPCTAEEEVTDYMHIDKISLGTAGGEYVAITIKGNSMLPTYENGDTVVVKRQNNCNDGEIAVVLIDDEVTIKKVRKQGKNLVLQPLNPEYDLIFCDPEHYDNVRIYGIPKIIQRRV